MTDMSTATEAHPHAPVSHNLVGQRLGRKGQETRERILSAMLRLLDDPDGPPVTLTGVAREATVGMTTLYLYFPDMGDLLLSTLKRVMDSSEQGYVHHLRDYWPDETLAEQSRDFMRDHYRFWKRHARLLHMRNSFADASDARVMQYRTEVSLPVLDLLALQMGDGDAASDAMSPDIATVLMVGFERVATVLTNPLFYDGAEDANIDKAAYIDKLICAQARLVELAIRHQRTLSGERDGKEGKP